MNSELYQKYKNMFQVGDLVCYKRPVGGKMCGIVTETDKDSVKIYWCIDRDDRVDISPLSYPPTRKNGWIAAGLLKSVGDLQIVSKKNI